MNDTTNRIDPLKESCIAAPHVVCCADEWASALAGHQANWKQRRSKIQNRTSNQRGRGNIGLPSVVNEPSDRWSTADILFGRGGKWRRRNDGRAVESSRGLKGLIISACVSGAGWQAIMPEQARERQRGNKSRIEPVLRVRVRLRANGTAASEFAATGTVGYWGGIKSALGFHGKSRQETWKF
jgi:hypothetical protein